MNTTSNLNKMGNTLGIGGFNLVCDDPATGQALTFTEIDFRQVVTYSFLENGTERKTTLTDQEAAEITFWRNSGRRNSFWNWPGLDAVRERARSVL